jgi:DNA invertase Pin-like site-specific DNA recombinase
MIPDHSSNKPTQNDMLSKSSSDDSRLQGAPLDPSPARERQAYSYARFSTSLQVSGDSLRRQYKLSDAYAQKNNLVINRSLTDKGFLGYCCKHLQERSLEAFLSAIEMKRVKPGDILLVESLEGLSSKAVAENLSIFLRIVNAGIELVTLGDERVFTKANINRDPMQLLISIILMSLRSEKSMRKAGRVKHAWQSKRDNKAGKGSH